MKKLMFLCLLTSLLLVNAEGPKIGYTFNQTNHTLNLSFQVKSNFNYGIIRYDMKNDYYDVYTNFTATASGTNTVTVDPMSPSDIAQPTPSGQCYFYVVEQN